MEHNGKQSNNINDIIINYIPPCVQNIVYGVRKKTIKLPDLGGGEGGV